MNINTDSQLSFLNEDGTKTYLFITNQKNLLSFLSSGMITPSGSQFRYRADSRDFSSGAIPFWKGGLPKGEAWELTFQNKSLVVIEYSQDHVEKYADNFSSYESNGLVVVSAPVPISLASSIYMLSDEAIDDFLLRVPSDVIFDRSLFTSRPFFPRIENQKPAEINVTDISSQVETIDSFAGGVRGLSGFPKEAGLELISVVPAILTFLNVLSPSNVKWTGIEIHVSLSDQILLTALMPLLQEHKEENGFDPMSFLSALEGKIKENGGEVPDEVVKWFHYVRAVVNSEKEVRPLSDEGDIIQRALLLFTLRPSLERLQLARESSIAPGPKVLALAVFFAGCASGITRMAAEFKGSYQSYSRYVKSVLDAIWNKSILNARLIKSSTAGGAASTCFEVNGEVLVKCKARQDPVLTRVLTQAQSLGYEMSYDLESNELIYEAQIKEKVRQLVYVETLNSKSIEGLDVIKIISPCLHLPASKMQSLKKAQLLDLLLRNDSDNVFCAFALSQKRKALVVEATMIVNTMDDIEFVTLLTHVAKIASAYK
tara:strand:- start:105222 stop:106850 length:1629 start_codon:yes stop_codon:yes gene_type:complete